MPLIPAPSTMRFETALVTPELAQRLLADDVNVGNRRLRPGTVAKLARWMREDKWLLTHQPIGVSIEGRLVDGQHRLAAIVASGATVPMTIAWGVDPATFAVLDGQATRSTADALYIADPEIGGSAKSAAAIIRIVAGYRAARHNGLTLKTGLKTVSERNDSKDWIEEYTLHGDSLDLWMLEGRNLDRALALGSGAGVAAALLLGAYRNSEITDDLVTRAKSRANLQHGDPALALTKWVAMKSRPTGNDLPAQAFHVVGHALSAALAGKEMRRPPRYEPNKLPDLGLV